MKTKQLVIGITAILLLFFTSTWLWSNAYAWFQCKLGVEITRMNLNIAGKMVLFIVFAIVFWFGVAYGALEVGRRIRR